MVTAGVQPMCVIGECGHAATAATDQPHFAERPVAEERVRAAGEDATDGDLKAAAARIRPRCWRR
jgi:hypothetical protein